MLSAGGKAEGLQANPCQSTPTQPTLPFRLPIGPWGVREMTGQVGWLFLLLQLGLETLTSGGYRPETQLC